MKKIPIKEFKKRSKIDLILDIMKMNNGYVTSKQISYFGIHRMYLSIMQQKGLIEKVGKGIYIDSKKIEDSFFIMGLELPKIVYSHMTALYFHGLSIKAPDIKYDITVPNNYFNYKLRKHNIFYVKKNIYNLGITEVETPFGNKVKVYDVERCICDIVRSQLRMDPEYIRYSIRKAVDNHKIDIPKLSMYAKKMGISDLVLQFVRNEL